MQQYQSGEGHFIVVYSFQADSGVFIWKARCFTQGCSFWGVGSSQWLWGRRKEQRVQTEIPPFLLFFLNHNAITWGPINPQTHSPLPQHTQCTEGGELENRVQVGLGPVGPANLGTGTMPRRASFTPFLLRANRKIRSWGWITSYNSSPLPVFLLREWILCRVLHLPGKWLDTRMRDCRPWKGFNCFA